MKKELITKLNPKSPVSENFRSLRTNIQYMAKSGKSQTILLTSVSRGEGKSWASSNLAITFAQAGKNVIIIDSDMRRPRQNKIFEINMFPGLSNYLSGVQHGGEERSVEFKECIRTTEIENLFVLPAGSIPPNPSELLSSKKMANLIDELKEIFDIIIVDGAPCLVVTDATIISRLVDSTILVVAQKQTKMEDLVEAKKRIENVGGRVTGVILNRVKQSEKSYSNRYYYYAQDESAKNKSHSTFKEIQLPHKFDDVKPSTIIIEEEVPSKSSTGRSKNRAKTEELIEEIKKY